MRGPHISKGEDNHGHRTATSFIAAFVDPDRPDGMLWRQSPGRDGSGWRRDGRQRREHYAGLLGRYHHAQQRRSVRLRNVLRSTGVRVGFRLVRSNGGRELVRLGYGVQWCLGRRYRLWRR